MIKLLTVIGARPQIIKAAALSRAVRSFFPDRVEEKILHTGQHYDENMSGVFFSELGVPEPWVNLGTGSGHHGQQTAKMISGIEEVLLSEHFDGVVLYGDTNSTLAGAVAAAKLHVPVFHIEAGLRSFDMGMPEEQNRIVCDQLSSICFTPTSTATENLIREGFASGGTNFRNGKGRKICQCGDVMFDNALFFSSLAGEKCDILSRYGLTAGEYVLSTVHRDRNTDDPARLNAIFGAIVDISEKYEMKVALPLHPRTEKLLSVNLDSKLYDRLISCPGIVIMPPASFFEILVLEKNARVVMTDSGGVQKESFFFSRPCVVFREETEWVEIISHGAGVLSGADREKILTAFDEMYSREVTFPNLFGDGEASKHILENILDYL